MHCDSIWYFKITLKYIYIYIYIYIYGFNFGSYSYEITFTSRETQIYLHQFSKNNSSPNKEQAWNIAHINNCKPFSTSSIWFIFNEREEKKYGMILCNVSITAEEYSNRFTYLQYMNN
jgi:hypothetical protein